MTTTPNKTTSAARAAGQWHDTLIQVDTPDDIWIRLITDQAPNEHGEWQGDIICGFSPNYEPSPEHARLIASAPAMAAELAQLRASNTRLLEWMRYVRLPVGEQAKNDFAADLDAARAAIAQATEEQQ